MTKETKKTKVALVGYRLGIGGAEKAMANLSIFFQNKGLEVHNIIVLDVVSYNYAGKLLNLGKLKNGSNSVWNRLYRMYVLRNYLSQNNFDFIIDFRPRTKLIQELLISRLLYKSKAILSVRSFLIEYYMPKSVFWTRLIYKKAHSTVTVSEQTEDLIQKKYDLPNVTTIYNPIIFEDILKNAQEKIDIEFDYIIGVGQMNTNVKQFDKLIEAYSKSDLPQENIHLLLLGEGKNKENLIELSKNKKLQDKIHFMGHQDNPDKFVSKSKFFVLSSLNEGLPNVLLEALACGIPVVSFDCNSGPREIIKHQENGLLVENQSITALTQAMNLLVEDEKLYAFCKNNAKESIAHFSLENIGQQWLHLMKISETDCKE